MMGRIGSIALFVEGSSDVRHGGFLEQLWNGRMVELAGVPEFSRIIPISKKTLVALETGVPLMSGSAESFDQLLVRQLQGQPFDAAVLAWDLVPPWDPSVRKCRREETRRIFELLSQSSTLPEPFLSRAKARHLSYSRRHTGRRSSEIGSLLPGDIFPVCMEPMFEALLVENLEDCIFRVTRLKCRPANWPGRNEWAGNAGRGFDDVLAKAIAAAQLVRPRPKCGPLRNIAGGYRAAKQEWGEYLLRVLTQDPRCKKILESHPLIRRFAVLGTLTECCTSQ